MAGVIGCIPARLASTRLPRKLLLSETGKPLIQHVWEKARRASSLNELVIATDSEEIAAACRAFGARAEMTGDHPSGTDRIAEVIARSFPTADLVVNIQGDEPEIESAAIDQLVDLLRNNPTAEMSTLATTIRSQEARDSNACVKVVCDERGRALYFSRHAIPFCRDRDLDEVLTSESPWRQHLGVYGYRRTFLLEVTKRPPSRLEKLEKLEQLRALEMGATILVGLVEHAAVGIDTPDDYARFVARFRTRPGG
jgi:3-deoxy-manno-octulosonate cytidylyltransferase (CMP-KDO synthetase)